jgi:creatinine amidohydrolase
MLLEAMKSPEVAALPRSTPVVVPMGSLEQHGPHMPLYTDTLLCAEIVRRAEERLRERVLVTPMMWLGSSHHHMEFPGTISAEPRVYLDLVVNLVEVMLQHGFTRITLVNGHGGNIVPMQQALFELRQRHRKRGDLLLLACSYWSLGGRPADVDPHIRQTQMAHACEWETSMMLRLAPHLVGDYRAVAPVPTGDSFAPADRGWITRDRSPLGNVGDPRDATADKGESLFRLFTGDVVRLLERVLAWDGKATSGWDGPAR